MHRTNLYLTEEQERALDARARAMGMSRSAVVRKILDDELTRPVLDDPTVQGALAEVFDSYPALVDGLFDDDPDLRIDR